MDSSAKLEYPGAVEVIAHRGASFDAPENTLAAINLAWEQGSDAVEIDIHMSKEGRIVVMHDANVLRTAGVDLAIRDHAWIELKNLDVGVWKGPQFKGEKIPTLESILATVSEGKRILVEIKAGEDGKAILPELRKVLAISGKNSAQVAIICFDSDVAREAKRSMPNLEVYWLCTWNKAREVKPHNTVAEELISQAKLAGVDGIDIAASPQWGAEFVRQVKDAKLKLFAWTVDDVLEVQRLIEAGVDGITTNRPHAVKEFSKSIIREASL